MALQPPFFSKRDGDTATARTSPLSHTGMVTASAGALHGPSNSLGGSPLPAATAGGGSKLIVGPNIKLKGVEITDCDTLVVEGMVEATMDSRLMQIALQGAFKGSADIDIAEIHGEFHGNLTVRQKLTVHATGRVSGSIHYGKLVIEEGGQLSGDIHVGTVDKVGPTGGLSGPSSPLLALKPAIARVDLPITG